MPRFDGRSWISVAFGVGFLFALFLCNFTGKHSVPLLPELTGKVKTTAVTTLRPQVPPANPRPGISEVLGVAKVPKGRNGSTLSELLAKVQVNGVVVATTADSGYLYLTVNWICHLQKLGLDQNVIVFALDEGMYKEMQARGIPCYFEQSMKKSREKIGNWNSVSYNQVVHTKTKHQMAVLQEGYDLFFADVDIPWTSDYRPQMALEATGVDFLGQHNWPQNDMNTGFIYLRSNPRMVHFLQTVLDLEDRLEKGIIRTGFDPRHDIMTPSDDQSSIAFTLLCGQSTGQYPGRGDDGFPRGGPVPPGKKIVVQSKWQKGLLARRHGLRASKMAKTESRRTYSALCLTTSGVNITYAFLPPKYYQTGHKSFHELRFDRFLDNASTVYHPNFMKGGDIKVAALKKYRRWMVVDGSDSKCKT